jgi:hypothetical protein
MQTQVFTHTHTHTRFQIWLCFHKRTTEICITTGDKAASLDYTFGVPNYCPNNCDMWGVRRFAPKPVRPNSFRPISTLFAPEYLAVFNIVQPNISVRPTSFLSSPHIISQFAPIQLSMKFNTSSQFAVHLSVMK